jgi:hypothetical protein
VSPILLLLRDAASDPDTARLNARLERNRLDRMTSNARRLAEAGYLRAGVSVEHAADILWTYSSPELYGLLVSERGWPVERYSSFICDAMIAALLPPDTGLPA